MQLPLLRLPLELKRMIYWRTIVDCRSPTPQEAHESDFRAHWRDVPSPLLGVSKRIRGEVFDMLQNCPFTMRVTSYGATFDILGLSCFIAQKYAKSYGDLPDLRIEIWPPHPDRPIEMYYIWDHIRKLRDKLRAAPRIPKLIIWFMENRLAKWSVDGKLRRILHDDIQCLDDMQSILDHLACVTNVTKAHIRLPPSLRHNEGVRQLATNVVETMEGKGTLAKLQELALGDYLLLGDRKRQLKRATAEIKMAKLNAVTQDGEDESPRLTGFNLPRSGHTTSR